MQVTLSNRDDLEQVKPTQSTFEIKAVACWEPVFNPILSTPTVIHFVLLTPVSPAPRL